MMFPRKDSAPAWWRWALWLCVALCGGPAALRSQVAERVVAVEIQHVGPPAVSDSLVQSNMRLKVGDLYNRNAVDSSIQSLYRTGYFYNIRVVREPADGGVKLRYLLIGKPTLTEINFSGNKVFSEKKLRKKLTSQIGEPLDERKLHADAQEILKRYQKKGYRQTKVEYVPVIDAELGRGTVTFEITESPKVKIKDVVFVGAEAFSQRKLRKVIKTRRHWWLSWLTGSGVLKDDVFAEDKERLAEFYREAGYIDFELRDVAFEHPDPKHMIIKLSIYEGVQYRVGTVQFAGNELFTAEEIRSGMSTRDGNKWRRGLSMGPGQVFTPAGLRRDRQGVQDFYGARGYIDARVVPGLRPNTARGTIDLTYRITEGKPSHIELISIKGNTKTKDRVIRRELAVSPGELFDMVKVKLSTNRLYGLQYFSRVNAEPEDTDVPNRKNLVLTVEEKSTGDIRFGAGFSSIDELVGFAELTQGNADIFKQPLFFGTGGGQKLRLVAQFGTARRDIQFSFIEPWFTGRKLALGVDLYHRNMQFYSDVYDVVLTGARLTLTRALWNDYWRGSVGYSLDNVGLIDMPDPYLVTNPDGSQSWFDPVAPELRSEQGYNLISKGIASISYDSRNSVMLPNRGQNTTLKLGAAGGPLGGDADFYSIDLRTSHYFPGLLEGHVIEVLGRVGVLQSYHGDHSGPVYSPDIPLYERWFLGGLYTLRGYEYRSVGPYDSRGQEPIGGNTYWYASVEYSVPVISRLRFALFYDIGNVYPDSYSFATLPPNSLGQDYGAFSDDWGLGIRLNIPGMGPLRLDYAFPIQHDPFVNGQGRFQFSVGYTRGGY